MHWHYSIATVLNKFLLGKCASCEESYKWGKKIKIWNFWEHPLYEIWEYAFNYENGANANKIGVSDDDEKWDWLWWKMRLIMMIMNMVCYELWTE